MEDKKKYGNNKSKPRRRNVNRIIDMNEIFMPYLSDCDDAPVLDSHDRLFTWRWNDDNRRRENAQNNNNNKNNVEKKWEEKHKQVKQKKWLGQK